jgi:hypothetical protein
MFRRFQLGGNASAMPEIFRKQFSPERRHIGEGQKRAAVREKQHRDQQAARVAPALPALAEKRARIARKRAERWFFNHPDQRFVPGHIRQMKREIGA